MKIGILGAGSIGGALGAAWAAAGHTVRFGVRDPNSPKVTALLDRIQGDAAATDLASALSFGQTVLFAVPAGAMPELLVAAGRPRDGAILIDATNNVRGTTMNSLDLLAAHAPAAHLFRAFNHLGWENFAQPTLAGEQVDLFYCGEQGASRQVVHDLIVDIGLRPIYVGGLDQAPVVDSLTRLWFALAYGQGFGRRLAFKVLKETP